MDSQLFRVALVAALAVCAFGLWLYRIADSRERGARIRSQCRPAEPAPPRPRSEISWLLEQACRQCAAKRGGARSEEVAGHFPPGPLVFLQRLAPVYGYSVDEKGAPVDGEGRPIEVSALDEFVRESGVVVRAFDGFVCIGGTSEDPKVVFVSHGGTIVAEATLGRKDAGAQDNERGAAPDPEGRKGGAE